MAAADAGRRLHLFGHGQRIADSRRGAELLAGICGLGRLCGGRRADLESLAAAA